MARFVQHADLLATVVATSLYRDSESECRPGDRLSAIRNPGSASNDAVEFERARHFIADMLKRGYVLLVEHDGKLQRVLRFDETTDEYIVADGPLRATEEEPATADPTKRGRKLREK